MKPSHRVKSPRRMMLRGQRRRKSLQQANTIKSTKVIANAIHHISGCWREYILTSGWYTKRAMKPTVMASWTIKMAYTFLKGDNKRET